MDKLYELSTKYIFPSNPTTGTLGSIDYNVSLMQWSGIPFIGAKNETRTFRVWISIYGILVTSILTFIYTGLEVHDLILCWRNLDELTQNACLSLTHITGAVKILNVFYRRKAILRIIEDLKFLAKTYVISPKQKEAFFWGEFENKIPLTIYVSMVGCTGILGMILVGFDPINVAGKIFPYRVKMPGFLPFSIQLIYMSVAVFAFAIQIVGVDYLNVTLINQTRYQMEILNIAFDRLSISGEIDMDVNKYLNVLIEHHNLILNLREDIEDIFKFPILLQFLTSLLIFALTGFQATVSSDSGVILIYGYCACIFCQLFVYCWFGNEASEQGKTLSTRGYNSSWYDFDHRFRKSLIIFLMNGQRPFYFTAGGFMNLSLTTFSGILSKSYTYIAVLRQIYAEK